MHITPQGISNIYALLVSLFWIETNTSVCVETSWKRTVNGLQAIISNASCLYTPVIYSSEFEPSSEQLVTIISLMFNWFSRWFSLVIHISAALNSEYQIHYLKFLNTYCDWLKFIYLFLSLTQITHNTDYQNW